MKLNGIAHVQLTVSDMKRSRVFYGRLLELFEMMTLIDADDFFYAIGSRTGVAISPADSDHAEEAFHQRRPGLHHICFRARAREDVDEVYRFVVDLGARIVHPPREDGFAPGYYSVLFEDPDGIRLEVNFVPGKGHLGATDSAGS